MSTNHKKNTLLVIAVIAILLLASLIGNVVLLSMLNSTKNQLASSKAELTETQYQLAQYKSGEAVPTEAVPTETPAVEVTPAADSTAPAETDTATAVPTDIPATPEPTATPKPTPEPTPAGPYAGSNLAYEPLDTDLLPEQLTATVACAVDVNVRSGPGTNYTKLASVSSGSEMKVHASAYGWFLIEYKNNTYGWISGQYFFAGWMFDNGLNSFLKDIKPAKEYLSAPEKVTVTAANGANARCGYTTADTLVARLENGDVGVCVAYQGDWRLCNFKGTYGWVHKSNFQ